MTTVTMKAMLVGAIAGLVLVVGASGQGTTEPSLGDHYLNQVYTGGNQPMMPTGQTIYTIPNINHEDEDDYMLNGPGPEHDADLHPIITFGADEASTTTSSDQGTVGHMRTNSPIDFTQGYEMRFQNYLRGKTKVIRASSSGPVTFSPTELAALYSGLETNTSVSYPINLFVGETATGARAAKMEVGLKDVTEASTLNPQEMTVSYVCNADDPMFPDVNVVGDGQCSPVSPEDAAKHFPEYWFFVDLVCNSDSPMSAWRKQCKQWEQGPIEVGSDCIWQSHHNHTSTMAKMPEGSSLQSLHLNNYGSKVTSTLIVGQHDETADINHLIPIAANIDKLSLSDLVFDLLPNNQIALAQQPTSDPSYASTGGMGRKLLQGLYAPTEMTQAGTYMGSVPMNEQIMLTVEDMIVSGLHFGGARVLSPGEATNAVTVC